MQYPVNTTILSINCDRVNCYLCLMKHISILALSDATMTSIDSSQQLLNRVNEVLYAQEFIENNPTEIFTVEEICSKLGIGRRTFERRFKKCTGNSIAEYVQRVKVEFAKKQLELDRKSINEIIYEAGYNNIDTFRKVFKRYTDLSPIDYRKKFII